MDDVKKCPQTFTSNTDALCIFLWEISYYLVAFFFFRVSNKCCTLLFIILTRRRINWMENSAYFKRIFSSDESMSGSLSRGPAFTRIAGRLANELVEANPSSPRGFTAIYIILSWYIIAGLWGDERCLLSTGGTTEVHQQSTYGWSEVAQGMVQDA